MEYPCFVLHRSRDTEREILMQDLSRSLRTPVNKIEPMDGETLIQKGVSRKHIQGGLASAATISCTSSHAFLNQVLLPTNTSAVCIFEDDAVIQGDVNTFVKEMKDWDVLILGANEIVQGDLMDQKVYKVTRFWGSHALVLNKKAMKAVSETYKKTLDEKVTYPADWLYNRAIKEHSLRAYAPVKNLVVQKKGLLSTATGSIRN